MFKWLILNTISLLFLSNLDSGDYSDKLEMLKYFEEEN